MHVVLFCTTSVFEHIFQNNVKTNVTMTRKQKITIQMIFSMYVMTMKTAHDIRPPTREPHAL